MEELNEALDDLILARSTYVRGQRSSEWMDRAARRANHILAALGHADRVYGVGGTIPEWRYHGPDLGSSEWSRDRARRGAP